MPIPRRQRHPALCIISTATLHVRRYLGRERTEDNIQITGLDEPGIAPGALREMIETFRRDPAMAYASYRGNAQANAG